MEEIEVLQAIFEADELEVDTAGPSPVVRIRLNSESNFNWLVIEFTLPAKYPLCLPSFHFLSLDRRLDGEAVGRVVEARMEDMVGMPMLYSVIEDVRAHIDSLSLDTLPDAQDSLFGEISESLYMKTVSAIFTDACYDAAVGLEELQVWAQGHKERYEAAQRAAAEAHPLPTGRQLWRDNKIRKNEE